MSVTSQQVVSLLENVLFESPTQAAADVAGWKTNPAASSVAGLAAAMAAGPEESIAAHIVGYYLSALGRPPTAAEVQFYVSYAEKGLTSAQIAAGQVAGSTWTNIAGFFTNSPEFAARAGIDNSLGPTAALLEAVPWLFESVLGRTPSSAEISFYDTVVTSGAGLNTLLGYLTSSQEFHTDTASQIATALATYGTDIASGQPAPSTVGGTVTIGPPPPAPPPTPAPTPSTVFTTGTDTLTSTDASHAYSATLGGASATLTANDSLHGAGNTLNITDTSGATSQDLLPSGVSLTSIATITLTTSGNAGTDSAHPFDLSGVTGLTSVTLTSSGTQGDFINVGSATSLSVTTHGAGDTLAITESSLSTLTVSGAIAGVTLTDPSGPTSLTVDVNGLTLTGGFTDSSNHVTSLTIAGSGTASSIDALSDTALTSLTVSGAVTLGTDGTHLLSLPSAITNIDLSGDTAANNYVQINSATTTTNSTPGVILGNGAYTVKDNSGGNTIFTGTGSTTLDLGSHANDVVIAGTDGNYATSGTTTPNLIIQNAASDDFIEFSHNVLTGAPAAPTSFSEYGSALSSTTATAIQTLETFITSGGGNGSPNPAVVMGNDGTNTYIIWSFSGGGSLGQDDTVIIKILGGVFGNTGPFSGPHAGQIELG